MKDREPPAWIGVRPVTTVAAPWTQARGPAPSSSRPSHRPSARPRPASRRPAQPSRPPDVSSMLPLHPRTSSPPTIRSMPPARISSPPNADLVAARVTIASLEHALAAARQDADALRAELDALQGDLAAAAEQTEQSLLGLAVAVARRVVGRELATDPAILVGWVREALADPRLSDATIAVAPDVAPGSWGDLAPRVEVDAHLPPGAVEVRGTQNAAAVSADARVDAVAEHVGGQG